MATAHPQSGLLPMASPQRDVAVGLACADMLVASVDLDFGGRDHTETATQFRLGVTQTPFRADVEHKSVEITGPHLVRFHEVGDRIGSRIEGTVRSTWVVLSSRFLEDLTRHTPCWRAPFAKPFVAPPLPLLGEVHKFLARARAGVSPLWAEEQLAALLPRLLGYDGDATSHAQRSPTAGIRRLARDADALLGRDFAYIETLTELAKRLGVSASYLARAYRAATGRTLHSRIAHLRLAEALRRLADGANDLTALALELGYSSHSHFTAEFRRHLGVPPSRFRLNTQI